jgi:enamine deaminase RidA (YjgF/YER057c/UK114 family)
MLIRTFLLLGCLPCSTIAAQGAAPRFINPPGLVKPTGYTHVVVAPNGRTVYIAGQVALDSTGEVIGRGDFRAQAEQVFRNLGRALSSVGGTLEDVVKTTTYITDLGRAPDLRIVRTKHLNPAHPPANTLLVVSRLARADLLIEIEAVAVLRNVLRFTGSP